MTQPTKKRDGWLIVLYLLLLLAGLTLMGIGVFEYSRSHLLTESLILLGLGLLAVMIPAALYPIAANLASPPPTDAQAQSLELLRSIAERLLISDAAKRIAYREQDRNALRQAIRDDIAKRDFAAAMALVAEMDHTYGYREEAQEFREQILQASQAETERKVNEGIAAFDDILARKEWDRALAEAEKLHRLYPETPRVRGLERRVKESHERHKHELERQFLQASERDDVETAMELLKELDRYLSESEAEPFLETARGVIGKKRMNLGVQFKLAVQDKEWTQAVRVGEQIIREFPNTKMADEVRSRLDLLRERAAGEQAARAQDVRV
jgi:hypothetical protein